MNRSRGRIGRWARWGGVCLTVLIGAVWVFSGWGCVGFAQHRPLVNWSVGIAQGLVGLEVERFGTPSGVASGHEWYAFTRERPRWQLWFTPGTATYGTKGNTTTTVFVPLWTALLLVAAPTGGLWWRRRRERFGAGRCPRCGYELAGLAAGAACPECGRAER